MSWTKKILTYILQHSKPGLLKNLLIKIFYSDYKESSDGFYLSFWEAINLIFTIFIIILAIIGPWLISVPQVDPHNFDVNNVVHVPPLVSFNNILGTDIYGRSLISLFILGLHKSYLFPVYILILNLLITVPLAVWCSYHIKHLGFLNKFLGSLLIFSPIFIYLIYITVFPANLLGAFLAVFLSSVINLFYNVFREVQQLMKWPMMKIFILEGITFKDSLSLIIIPNLLPHLIRLFRRDFQMMVAEFILLNVLHISLHANNNHWGITMYNAWIYRAELPGALIVLTLAIALVIYSTSKTMYIIQTYITTNITKVRDKKRNERKLNLDFYRNLVQKYTDDLEEEDKDSVRAKAKAAVASSKLDIN